MKTIKSNMKFSPHGGVVPILKQIKACGIPQVIRKCLGMRKAQSKYGYEDVFIAWVLTALCGGKRLGHITKIQKKLSIIPGLKLPSHDTLGRVMKKLATETLTERSISKASIGKITFTDYNENAKMNKMLIQATKRAGALKEGLPYTVDIDATFIPTERRGAVRKVNDKGKIDRTKIGFNPMVCLIGELPVFISMRSGDAGARFQLSNCLSNCIDLLDESKIKVGRVISDAAGYSKEAFEMLDNRGIKFNVRFPYTVKMETFKNELRKTTSWRKTEIETANFFWDCEIADIPYKMYDIPAERHVSKTWRVVSIRIPNENENPNLERLKKLSKKKVLKESGKPYADTNWKEIGDYHYKFFITNDYDKPAEEIVNEYNKRGNAERQFSFMKNDFGWKIPPFMNMNDNTVFMIAAALANNIFRAMVMFFKEDVPQLKLKGRLREFQETFINVVCAYVDDCFVFFEEDILFEKLMK